MYVNQNKKGYRYNRIILIHSLRLAQILAKYGYEKSTDKQDVLNSILEYDSEEYGSARRQKIKLENDFVISLL